ncbi:hypothetical protein ACIRVF_33660 [Kitasatospora sp. NPDC101157]|uniref:hypothetical protein n=1 Tax=Kitasatospora sp. NPDC101157 TaxID=3364098 RepID=UPI0037F399B4
MADLGADTDGADREGAERLPALCSMDDEAIYGPTVYTWTLGQGIEHGYLADYRVLVPVVTDEDLRDLLNLPAVADLRTQRTNEDLLRLALQVAVLRAVADLDLRRVRPSAWACQASDRQPQLESFVCDGSGFAAVAGHSLPDWNRRTTPPPPVA